MLVQETIVETIEYRVILVLPKSRKILAISDVDGYLLPSLNIPIGTRPAEQLREAIQTIWKLQIFILEFFDRSPFVRCRRGNRPAST